MSGPPDRMRVAWLGPTVPGALLMLGAPAIRPTWLAPGAPGTVLRTEPGGTLGWVVPSAASLPITTPGDLIVGNASGAAARLARGETGQVLRVEPTGLLDWYTPPPQPMTAAGDLIVGAAGGVPTRLPVGASSQVLTVVGTTPTWIMPLPPGLQNPMTTPGDLIVGGSAGAPTRIGIGPDGYVLTLLGGMPAWRAPAGGAGGGGNMDNPMSALGDLIVGGAAGAPQRLAASTNTHILTLVAGTPQWVAPSWTTNPMTTKGDLILGDDPGGTPIRLALGTAGQVLTIAGGMPTWQTPTSGSMANPMTSVGDLIIGGTAGLPGRLGIGTNGYVLTVAAGVPVWQAVTGGVTWPLLAPDGLSTAPSYSFASAPAVGLFLGGSDLVLTADAGRVLRFTSSGAACWVMDATGMLTPAVDGAVDVGSAALRVRDLHLSRQTVYAALGGAPVTPAAGKIVVYGKSDKKIYAKDDAGLETLLGSGLGNPMSAPGDLITGGTAGAPTRLAIGAANQVLTVISGIPTWQTATALTNPMIAVGDLIVGGASGAPNRLAAPATGQVLASAGVGVAPVWSANPALTKVTVGDGAYTGPSYSFAGDATMGLWRSGSNVVLSAPSGGQVHFLGGSGAYAVLTLDGLNFPLRSSVATPASGYVEIYAKTDKKMYAKDDAGVETPLGGGGGGGVSAIRLPIEQATLPDGTPGNLPVEFVRWLTGAAQTANTPKPTSTVAKFDWSTDRHLMWSFMLPSNYGSGGTVRLKWFGITAGAGSVVWKAGMTVHADEADGFGWRPFNAADLVTSVAPAGSPSLKEATIMLTMGGATAGRLMTLFIGRDGDNAADTLGIEAVLASAQFEYIPA